MRKRADSDRHEDQYDDQCEGLNETSSPLSPGGSQGADEDTNGYRYGKHDQGPHQITEGHLQVVVLMQKATTQGKEPQGHHACGSGLYIAGEMIRLLEGGTRIQRNTLQEY